MVSGAAWGSSWGAGVGASDTAEDTGALLSVPDTVESTPEVWLSVPLTWLVWELELVEELPPSAGWAEQPRTTSTTTSTMTSSSTTNAMGRMGGFFLRRRLWGVRRT